MKIKNLLFIAIAVAAIGLQAMQMAPRFLKITFENRTGHDLTIKTKYNELKPAGLIYPIPLLKNEQRIFTDVNPDEIKEYELFFTNGIRGSAVPSLKILGSEIGFQAANQNSDEVKIFINPKKIFGYVIGFDDPTYGIELKNKTQPEESKKFEEQIPELEANLIFSEIKGFEPEEKKLIYARLGVKPDAPAYEILGLSFPPKPEPNKAPNEQPEQVRVYFGKAYDNYSSLSKKWETSQNTLQIDKEMLEKYKIDNFSKKIRDILRAAYIQIQREAGL